MDTSAAIFHANCLINWNTSNCPVCYYIKNPDLMKNSACMKCDNSDSLWFCIICAHVGCGHMVDGHASEHYEETKHKYVMDLQRFNVWDYNIKKFLHSSDKNDQRLENSYIETLASGENNCSCPVCRHIRTPKLLKQPVCMQCEEYQVHSLWICLHCSHIGCGRNKNHHAQQHYTNSKHQYAMQMDNFSIWDYKEHKFLHRQLHDTALVKSEVSEFVGQHIKEDFLKRLDSLERQWHEFSKLTETNKQIITIEERLLILTDEKKVLEEKLYEHDTKLNDLLSQFATNKEDYSTKTFLNLREKETTANGSLRKTDFNEISCDVKTPKSSFLNNNTIIKSPLVTSTNLNQTEFISVMFLGLVVYYFFRLCWQKLTESFINLF